MKIHSFEIVDIMPFSFLYGGVGNDRLEGGLGSDTYYFNLGDGVDTIYDYEYSYDRYGNYKGGTDKLIIGDINKNSLIASREGDNLKLSVHGTEDGVVIDSWYKGRDYVVEQIYTSDGGMLSYAQVGLLIQAMASFTADTGMSWNDALLERPEDVNNIISQYWVQG